jgi:hypothetical protein
MSREESMRAMEDFAGLLGDRRRERMNTAILGLILGLSGLGILIYADWRIALGVFLSHWSANIQRRA